MTDSSNGSWSVSDLPVNANGKMDRQGLLTKELGISVPKVSEKAQGAPHSEVEARLLDIWQELLGVESIGVHDNFFELGGDSFDAVLILARVADAFGKQLPLSSLMLGPTIAELAAHLRGPAPAGKDSLIVPLQPDGSQRPFFCVHGVGGEVLFLRPLARLLGSDQPFFGLRARGIAPDEKPEHDIPSMAARYIRAIRSIVPHGPYKLGGFSAGGTIAYEMAQQLHSQREEVILLAIFDSSPPNVTPPTRSFTLGRFFSNVPLWIREDLFRCQPARLFHRIMGKLMDLPKGLSSACAAPWQRGKELNIRALFGVPTLPAAYHRLLSAHYQALSNYHPQRYFGPLTLFRARTRPLLRAQEPDLNWGQLAAGPFSIHQVPGCHRNMFEEPFVHELARALTAILREETTHS